MGTEQARIARLLRRVDTGLAATLVVFAIGSYAALSVDVGRTAYGLKGDEATYVAMALSMAHARDLVYEPRDIERFYHVYHRGPEGIHLKRGGDGRDDRLYFGKAFAYSVAASNIDVSLLVIKHLVIPPSTFGTISLRILIFAKVPLVITS